MYLMNGCCVIIHYYSSNLDITIVLSCAEKVIPLCTTITILSNNAIENVFTDGDTITLRVLGHIY